MALKTRTEKLNYLNNDFIATNEYRYKIYGYNGNDSLVGSNNNDTLYGGEDNDTLKGGKGNDKLYGDAGINMLYFYANDGNDTVYSNKYGEDTLVFDVDFTQLSFTKNKNNLIISGYGSNTDKVTVSNYFKGNSIINVTTTDNTYNLLNKYNLLGTTYGKENKNNSLTGTILQDVIHGNNKNDVIKAGKNDDELFGEAGNDKLYGQDGNDFIWGGEGNDKIYGGKGLNNIYFSAGDGSDTIYSEGYNNFYEDNLCFYNTNYSDLIFTKNGNNMIISGYGSEYDKVTLNNYFKGTSSVKTIQTNDGIYDLPQVVMGKTTLSGNSGSDYIIGTSKNDTINADAGNDTIYSGSGNDNINAGSGNDYINGEKGNDIYFFDSNSGLDTIVSTLGTDTICFNHLEEKDVKINQVGNDLIIECTDSSKVTLKDFALNKSSVEYIRFKEGSDVLIEEKLGKIFGAHIIGTNGNNNINGTNGDDTIHGKLGSDTIYGKDGNDIIDTFIDAYIDGGNGNDYISVSEGFSTLIGGDGNDTIYGNKFHNRIIGGDGHDKITSYSSNYIEGGNGNDYISIYDYHDAGESSTIYAGLGDDTIMGYSKYSYIYTQDGNDSISLDGDGSVVDTGLGNDTIIFKSENNVVNAGEGNNIVYFESYTDNYNVIKTGSGNDTFTFNHLKRNATIEDSSGIDELIIEEYHNYIDCYINVYKNGTYDKDLIMNYSMNYDEKLTIKNYISNGKIETIESRDYYTLDSSSLNLIINQVASWLSTNNYDSVQTVIDSGNTTNIDAVIDLFASAWQR